MNDHFHDNCYTVKFIRIFRGKKIGRRKSLIKSMKRMKTGMVSDRQTEDRAKKAKNTEREKHGVYVLTFFVCLFFCCWSVTRPMNMYTTTGARLKCHAVCQGGFSLPFYLRCCCRLTTEMNTNSMIKAHASVDGV